MIDFKITFKADELLYGDYKKMSLISKIMFRKFLRQFKTKTAQPSLTKFKYSVLPRKRISHYEFGFLILSVSSSISILFYQNWPNRLKVMLF